MKKKLNVIVTAVLLALAITSMPTNVQAQTGNIVASGANGATSFWALDQEGTLTITGTGAVAVSPHSGAHSGAPWWNYRNLIRRIVVGEGMTNTGNFAFAELPNLEILELPASLAIPLTTVTGAAAELWFRGSNNLREIIVAPGNPNLTVVSGALIYNDSLLYRYPVGRSDASFTIPTGITRIIRGAFAYNTTEGNPTTPALTSISIPDGVWSIGVSAFRESGLTSITIPSTVTIIDAEAFFGSANLAGTITLPPGFTTLNASAFRGTQITEINFPASFTTMPNASALASNALQTITVATGNPNFVVVGDVLYSRFPTSGEITSYRVARYPSGRPGTTWAVPANITVGGTEFPVSGIGAGAFLGNPTLTSVDYTNITAAFAEIGTSAFEAATGLTSLSVPHIVDGGLKTIGLNAFDGAINLATAELPLSLTSINNFAFRNCSTLNTINIPDSITAAVTAATAVGFLGTSVFHNCVSLTQIDLNNLVTLPIGTFAFTGLTSLTVPATLNGVRPGTTGVSLFQGMGTSGNLGSLQGTPLTEITVAWDSVPRAGTAAGQVNAAAFTGLDRSRVILTFDAGINPDTVAAYKIAEFWRDFAFEQIGEGALPGTDITWECFDNGLLAISGTGPMGDFTNENPGTSAPWNVCRATTKTIIIDSLVTTIGAHAFRDFGVLDSIVIPATVTSIGDSAFANAIMLTDVNVKMIEPVDIDGKDVFVGRSISFVNLITPEHSRMAYYLAPVWQNFRITGLTSNPLGTLSWIFEATSGTLYINGTGDMANYAFSTVTGTTAPWNAHRNHIRVVNIAEGVTSIGANAFLNHPAMTLVTIPQSVTTIGDFAFMNCRSLRVVNVSWPTPPEVVPTVFANVGINQTFLFTPPGTAEAYRNAEVWRDFKGDTLQRGIAPTTPMGTWTPGATVGVPYSTQFTTTGTVATWAVTANTTDFAGWNQGLPHGLSIHPVTGIISGTPTLAGNFQFIVRVFNNYGSAHRTVQIAVAAGAAPEITPTTLTNGEVGIAYTATLEATGETPVWALSGNVPSGLNLNKTTGVLSGTPTTAGSFTFEVVVTSSLGQAARSYTVVIAGTSLKDLVDSLQGVIDSLKNELDICLNGGTSVSPNISAEQINIYPNPVNNELNIVGFEWTSGDIVELFDMNGRRVYMNRVDAPVNIFTINMSLFQSGNYILRIGNRIARVVKQ